MASGLLTGAMTSERAASLPADDFRSRKSRIQGSQAFEESRNLWNGCRKVGARHGRGPGEVAIAWVLRHPASPVPLSARVNAQQAEGVMPRWRPEIDRRKEDHRNRGSSYGSNRALTNSKEKRKWISA